jgi:pimeloyl-ACP methyl ester carboxylesterase
MVLSRQLTDRSWSSYAAAMTEIVLGQDGRRQALRLLRHAGIPVVHAVGAGDVLAPPHAVAALGEQAAALRAVTHPTGGHLLPLDCPEWCVQVLTGAMNSAGRRHCMVQHVPERLDGGTRRPSVDTLQ